MEVQDLQGRSVMEDEVCRHNFNGAALRFGWDGILSCLSFLGEVQGALGVVEEALEFVRDDFSILGKAGELSAWE